MALETIGSFNPAEDNGSGYYGLIQFGSATAKDMGTTTDKLKTMTALAQLDYVEKHIARKKDKIKNITDLYLSILNPASTGLGDQKKTVLWDHNRNAYFNNPALHQEEGEWATIKKKIGGKDKRGFLDGKTYIWEVEMYVQSWYTKGLAKNNKCKKDTSTCAYGSSVGEETSSDGVLEEMKKLADKHIPYSQLGVRDSLSDKGMEKLDCSEFVGIYLHKLGVMPSYTSLYTGNMIEESAFRNAIGTDNIDFVEGSKSKDFTPKKGDVFVWGFSYYKTGKKKWKGHTGVVYKTDGNKIFILEAVTEASEESFSKKNGGDKVNNSTRTSVYKKEGKALSSHEGWKGYFRPKKYNKKL